MTLINDPVVQKAITSLGSMDVPPILQDRIQKHQLHLMSLAAALLAGGQSREDIRRTIEVVMDSFKQELATTIEALMENRNAL